jgi:hypothetical protein
MADPNVPEPPAWRHQLAARLSQAAKAADLLRSAVDRIEAGDPDETRSEQAARLRGVAVLALTASLEISATSGWLEALAWVEAHRAK